MTLCKYKDVFGKPREGVHQYRIFNFAIVDVLLTILAAIVISKTAGVSVVYTIISLFLIAIVTHKIFCVDTALNQMIFS